MSIIWVLQPDLPEHGGQLLLLLHVGLHQAEQLMCHHHEGAIAVLLHRGEGVEGQQHGVLPRRHQPALRDWYLTVLVAGSTGLMWRQDKETLVSAGLDGSGVVSLITIGLSMPKDLVVEEINIHCFCLFGTGLRNITINTNDSKLKLTYNQSIIITSHFLFSETKFMLNI